MARIHITLPESFIFTTHIPLRIGDINRAWHLSHVNMVSILEEARAQFMTARGFEDEVRNVGRKTGFILGDLGVVYRRQGYYGQTLEIGMAAVDFAEKSFDLVYQVKTSGGGEELARAKTGILVFDYEQQKVIPVSEEIKLKLTV